VTKTQTSTFHLHLVADGLVDLLLIPPPHNFTTPTITQTWTNSPGLHGTPTFSISQTFTISKTFTYSPTSTVTLTPFITPVTSFRYVLKWGSLWTGNGSFDYPTGVGYGPDRQRLCG